jgi:hypothetical protein
VAIGAPAQAPTDQRLRVQGAMAQLRSLGVDGVLGATVQQAIQEGRD